MVQETADDSNAHAGERGTRTAGKQHESSTDKGASTGGSDEDKPLKQPGARLSSLLDSVIEETDGDTMRFGDLMDTIHTRSYGPLILLPAVIAASPVGAIPGMSIVTGSVIALLSGQMLFGMPHPWLPKRLEDFSFDREKFKSGVERVNPWIKRFEIVLKTRLTQLATSPVDKLVALACVVLGVLFYPLALIPFAVFVPAVAVTCFALGLVARDGLLVISGFALTATVGWLLYAFWPF